MLKLSLDALQVLDAIDRGGSFAAAAKELFRVPSTISYSVSKLEDDLDVKVFERSGPKVMLTAAGRELLLEGRYLLKAAQDLEHKVRKVASGWETEFSIGMDMLFSPMLIDAEIQAFYKATDTTRLRMSQEALSGTWEALLDRRVDLLLGAAGEGPSGGGYVSELVGNMPFVFAVAPSHPLASLQRPLGKSDLIAHRVIAVADTARRLPARTVGLLVGQNTLTVPTIRCKFAFQLAGLGIGFLPECWARQAINSGQLIEKEVDEPRAAENFYIAWRTGEQGAALSWWIENLRKANLMERLVLEEQSNAPFVLF
jgi:DNA-binding transcriptional LysR family regulator